MYVEEASLLDCNREPEKAICSVDAVLPEERNQRR